MTVHVVTAEQAAARDAAAIAAGIPSMQLMRRAGLGAARVIRAERPSAVGMRVVVCCGPGNNGGDGWIVAAAIARAGASVHVREAGEPRTGDAAAARDEALGLVSLGAPADPPDVLVDALLGTGARGALRGAIAELAAYAHEERRRGTRVVALDLPTGLDATTGELAEGGIVADVTISFATIKRGHLLSRSACGKLLVVDIGLGRHAALEDGAPILVDPAWFASRIPLVPAEAHKGTRRRILIVGGDRGMAGAVALAARGALRAGVGMVRLCVHEASLAPLQGAVPEATGATWSDGDPDPALVAWPHAVLIGPGLGGSDTARDRVTRWLTAWTGPVVLDADALNAFAGDEAALGDLLDGRPAIVTPHPLEFARLIGVDVDTVLEERFEVGARLARALHATVLLKGVPSVITAPDGTSMVSARGTPVLATAGSGDILGGIAATLLAQTGDPFAAAACAAYAHGRAGEIANAGRPARGVVLDEVVSALGTVWDAPALQGVGVLAELPAIGQH